MLLLFGKKLNESKKVCYALKDIFGIGISSAAKICSTLNIPPTIKIYELTEMQKAKISAILKQEYILESKLKQQISENINNLITINSIKGFRHRSKLPVRGQRTHSNAKTCRKINRL